MIEKSGQTHVEIFEIPIRQFTPFPNNRACNACSDKFYDSYVFEINNIRKNSKFICDWNDTHLKTTVIFKYVPLQPHAILNYINESFYFGLFMGGLQLFKINARGVN